jgi:hypothetical protein
MTIAAEGRDRTKEKSTLVFSIDSHDAYKITFSFFPSDSSETF